MKIDLHTHSIASGHGTYDTISKMASSAAQKGMSVLGFSEHAPAMSNAASVSYFQSLRTLPRSRFGVSLLFGAELNILSSDGAVDLADSLLAALDYAIASMHSPLYKNAGASVNTSAYIHAMKHPNVRIIGHPDDVHFPIEVPLLVRAAKKYQVLIEINNSSLSPASYRKNAEPIDRALLFFCSIYQTPVIIGSDSHGHEHIGDDQYARRLISQLAFPSHLIANDNPKLLSQYLHRSF